MEIRAIKNKFRVGMHVRFVPPSAKDDSHHPDCRDGIVGALRGDGVIVNFWNRHELCDFDELEIL